MRIEKVFQIPKAGNLYENIKITGEGETIEECLRQIYHALYMDRIVSMQLSGNGDVGAVYELITKINEIIDSMGEAPPF